MRNLIEGICRVVFLLLLAGFGAAPAGAALVIHYDPDTGNVSFDTAGSPTGRLGSYELTIDPSKTDVRFRPENHVRVSNSPFYFSRPLLIGDDADFDPLVGLFTIGDILPVGLGQDWYNVFGTTPYYSDVLAGDGAFMYGPVAYSYGRPEGEFINRLGLLDPDELDWAQTATLSYDVNTGEVVLKTDGPGSGYMSSFIIESGSAFLPDAFTPPTDSPFVIQSPTTLSQFLEILEPGVYSLGEILAAGLSAEEFTASITDARFMTRAGYDFGSFDFDTHGQNFALVWLPEPSTAIVLTGLIVGLAMRRSDGRMRLNHR